MHPCTAPPVQLQMERRERLRRTLAQQEAVSADLPPVGQVVVQEMAPVQVRVLVTYVMDAGLWVFCVH